MTGIKFDAGKAPLDLLPPDALEGIALVLGIGRDKYGAYNWAKGMKWSRVYAALLRHLFAWWRGDNTDAESKLSHLYHAGCCILFLIAYEMRGVGEDDRHTSQPAGPAGEPTEVTSDAGEAGT